MPSGFWTGVAGGAQSQLEKALDERRKQKYKEMQPSYQIQSGILSALQTMQKAPTTASLQEQSDLAERQAGLAQPPVTSSAPSGRLDMNSLVQSLAGGATPAQVGQSNQASQFMKTLEGMGISSLGSDSIGMSRYGGATSSRPIVFQKSTGKYHYADTGEEVTGEVPRGAPIRNAQAPIESEVERAKQLAAAGVEGKGPSLKDDTSLETFNSSLRSIENIEKNLSGPQGGLGNLLQSSIPGIPGQTGLAFEINNVRDNLLRLKSGAQINEAEYKRLSALLPEIWDGPGVSQRKLAEFKTVFKTVVSRQSERFGIENEGASGGLAQDEEDFLNSLRQ